jgi:20S proteasome alpha/beta subunit
MTIVAAYKTKDGIWFGADTQASDEVECYASGPSKILQRDGFTIASSGSYRVMNILRHCFKFPIHNKNIDDDGYMVSVWVDALMDTLEARGARGKDDGGVAMGGRAIVAYGKNLYVIQGDFSLLVPSNNYIALGSGSSFSLGAMYALDGYTPGDIVVTKAVEAAMRHAPTCGGTCETVFHPYPPSSKPKSLKER